ncbi:unnamed protein product [Microthlaspi erraticum]|uniref:FBD domain-containing protein n=1 Tax=Microthlaspi erraticum TaxID=1685480 RepID=A0A6D2HU34_9BRAS|nr:unnamed protein product [Microthlaspi erraticum]
MMDIGSKDLISNLPDALVCHILSFLSTEDAALTSVLAKRWRYLLAFVPNLDLDNASYDHPEMGSQRSLHLRQSFNVFVDRVMALQGKAPVNKFSLRCEDDYDPSRVNGWIFNVLERGVVDLDLYIEPDSDYSLPSKVLMSKTLVRLKVEGVDNFTTHVGDFCLPRLKTLYLDDVGLEDTGASFAKLISVCHVLEELVMIDVGWDFWDSCSVFNPSLKRLKILCDSHIEMNPNSVSFDTPNLVFLDLTDKVAIKYPKANFDSLVEARLDLRTTLDQNEPAGDSADATDLFMGIRNVEILSLSGATVEVLTICCKAIPVFNNLIQLTIETDRKRGWESLPNLLKNCPNLETLVFQGLDYKDTDGCGDEGYKFKDTNICCNQYGDICMCKPWEGTPICLTSSPVKVLKVLKFGEITNFIDFEKQLLMIKYFLETMPNLEQVILYYDTPFDDDMSLVSTALYMLEKVASTKCKIQVVSDSTSYVHSASALFTTGLAFIKTTFPV